MDTLVQDQWGATKMMKHLSYEKMVREPGLSSQEKKNLRGILAMFMNTWQQWVKKTVDPSSSQGYAVTGEETMGKKWNTWIYEKTFFIVRVTEHRHRCPDRLWSLPPWGFKTQMDMVLGNQLYLTCSELESVLDNLQRPLPTSAILWSTEKVQRGECENKWENKGICNFKLIKNKMKLQWMNYYFYTKKDPTEV